MWTEPGNINIRVLKSGKGYKSISNVEWMNIPHFSIITGKNGSGKTQFLEVLAYYLTGTRPVNSELGVEVHVGGARIEPDEVGFVPSSGRFSGGSGASASQMQNLRQSLYQQAQNRHNYPHDPAQMSLATKIERVLRGRDWQRETQNGILSLDEDEFSSLLVDLDVVSSLATIFVVHRIKILEALERGTPGVAKDGNPLGPAPWDIVNESLKVAGFPYEVNSPTEVGFLEYYELRLRDVISKVEVPPRDLSSGEQVLLQLTLWLFSSGKKGIFPKLLLLDEPDAHLHPSMTVQFLDVITEVLVRKHGIRVIMTTHSPSTVALAPEGSIFQIERGVEKIVPAYNRSDVISILTAGLVTVSPTTKFCFVEDEDDVKFYTAVFDILSDTGPSKDSHAIKPSPSLVFIAASIGKSIEKVSGGKSVVKKWVDKFENIPLNQTFLGILDRDSQNLPSQKIKVIGRYSFENYLLDPVNVFGLLLENGTAPSVTGLSVTSGDEHRLRTLSNADLQSITDAIIGAVEVGNSSMVTAERKLITYTNGCEITVPNWVLDCRGHDLLQMYQGVWGGHQVITPPRLIKALRRVRLIPLELATLFADLQA